MVGINVCDTNTSLTEHFGAERRVRAKVSVLMFFFRVKGKGQNCVRLLTERFAGSCFSASADDDDDDDDEKLFRLVTSS